mmetsp:Transcript_19964/g.31790  ORF Transcript_19964/g.31790 Transcript_19964/m.31790 type:complete len:218 (+) Transcript_19964:1068-1721(+)
MARVGIITGACAYLTNERRNLVFAFARHIGVGQNHLNALPAGIKMELVRHPVTQRLRQLIHEWRAWRNHIVVPTLGLWRWHIPSLLVVVALQFLARRHQLVSLLRRTKTTRTLLIHFTARRNTIDGEIQQFAWTHHAEQMLNVLERVLNHFVLVFRLGTTLWMTTRMNDAVHVEIEIVVLHAIGILSRRVWQNSITIIVVFNEFFFDVLDDSWIFLQ